MFAYVPVYDLHCTTSTSVSGVFFIQIRYKYLVQVMDIYIRYIEIYFITEQKY